LDQHLPKSRVLGENTNLELLHFLKNQKYAEEQCWCWYIDKSWCRTGGKELVGRSVSTPLKTLAQWNKRTKFTQKQGTFVVHVF
jgi:hypothetical protein